MSQFGKHVEEFTFRTDWRYFSTENGQMNIRDWNMQGVGSRSPGNWNGRRGAASQKDALEIKPFQIEF